MKRIIKTFAEILVKLAACIIPALTNLGRPLILIPKYMMVVRLRKVKSAVLLPIKPSKKQVKSIPRISIPLLI